MRYINGGKATSMEEINEFYMPRIKRYTNKEEGWGLWKVITKQNNSFIGWILVRPWEFFGDKPEHDNLELGWRFARDSWGKGYATEAVVSIRDALMNRGHITRLMAIALEENKASIHVMEKIGMKYIKTDTHKAPHGESDVVFYDMKVK